MYGASILIDISISFPPDNKEKEEQLGNFFQTYPPPSIAGKVPDYVKAIQQKDSSVAKFGILGVRFLFVPVMRENRQAYQGK